MVGGGVTQIMLKDKKFLEIADVDTNCASLWNIVSNSRLKIKTEPFKVIL